MKLLKRAAALAALVSTLWAPMSRAAITWYVSQNTGTDYCAPNDTANCGRSAAHPFKTIGAVNSRMNAGDKCYVYQGAYSDKPNPKNAAWDGDLTHWYRFIGLGPAGQCTGSGPNLDLCCGDAARTMHKDFVSLRNFAFPYGFMLSDSCNYDSLITISSSADVRLNGSDHTIVDGLTQPAGSRFYVAAGTGWLSTGVKIFNSSLASAYFGTPSVTSGVRMGKCDSLLIHGCTFPGISGFGFWGLTNSAIKYTKITQQSPSGSARVVVQDSCRKISFVGDTLLNTAFQFRRGYNYGTIDTVAIESCFVRSGYQGPAVDFQCAAKRLTLRYSTLLRETGPTVTAVRWHGRNLIDHNTIYGADGNSKAPLDMMGRNTDSTFTDTTLVTNNIIYNAYKSPQPCHLNCLEGGTSCSSPPGACIDWLNATMDSSYWAGDPSVRHAWSNGNLYVNWNMIGCPAAATATIEPGVFADTVSVVAGAFADTVSITLRPYIGADTTFKVRVTRTTVTPPSSGKLPIVRTVKTAASTEVTAGCDTLSNGPGGFSIGMNFPYSECYGTFTQAAGLDSGTTNWNTVWCPSCDDSSYMGSPQFVDSTRASFDAHILSGSLAIGNALDESDIGAVAWVPHPMVYVPPPGQVEFYETEVWGLYSGSQTKTITLCNVADTTYNSSWGQQADWHSDMIPILDLVPGATGPSNLQTIEFSDHSRVVVELEAAVFECGNCSGVDPQAARHVSVTWNIPGAPLQDHTLTLVVRTNDPRRPIVYIPIVCHADGS